MQPRNLAARAGRWSATHRKTAILGWILFVVLATLIGGKVGQQNLESSQMGNGESKRHDVIVDNAKFPDEIGERVLIQGKGSVTADSPQVTAAVKDVVNRLEQIKGVENIESPLNAQQRANTVSKDGRSVLVTFTMPGKAETKEETEALEHLADAPVAAVAAVQKAHPELRVEEHGGASEQKALGAQQRADEAKEKQFSMGGTLLILLLTFGALVAAGIPLLLGVTSIAATMGLLAPLSQLSPLHAAVAQVVMLIGLAVGVDYAMFYLRRMLEEQDKGRSPEAALDVAAATSGRAVLISGFTVIAAMAGMFFSGNAIFSSFGIGTILVVAVAMIGSLTFLPAVLSYLGQKGWLEKGRLPFIAKRRHKNKGESRVWNAILNRVLARPVLSVVLAGGLLVALAIPALGMQFKEAGTEGMSRSQPIIQTLDRVDAAFPGGSLPATVAIKAKDVTTPEVQTAIKQLHDKAIATGQLSEPTAVDVNADKTVAVVSLAIKGKGTDAASERSLETLRDEVVPATVGKLDNTQVAVGGMTAWSKDFLDTMKSHLPLVFAFVLAMAFILLLVTFRSIVVPIKAIILNLLSVGAAYGILDARLPGRPRGEAARVQLGRRHHALAPAVPVRRPLRPVDGLPRVRPQQGPRARRPRPLHRGGRGRGHQEHGRRDHERRRGHGRHVRRLRDRLGPADEAAGCRPRGRHPDRRHDRPGGPPARHDEAPRRAQLVAAEAPRLAAEARARAGGGAGRVLSR